MMGHMTRGLIEAEVTTTSTSEGGVEHQLDLIAPALDGYRQRILTAGHKRDLVYPVDVWWVAGPGWGNNAPAYNDEEFMRVAGKALRSDYVRAMIASLIVRSNERAPSVAGGEDASVN
jgi:hypothetical protein